MKKNPVTASFKLDITSPSQAQPQNSMSSQESTRSALSVKKSFKKLRERHTRLERERDNLVKNVLRTKDVDSLKIKWVLFPHSS